MENDWKIGYKQALLGAFLKSAQAVMEEPSFYGGWEDYTITEKVTKHLNVCNISIENSTAVEDSYWREFMGTFYEGDTTQYGLDAYISCHCGYISNIHMRLESTFSELLLAVLRE